MKIVKYFLILVILVDLSSCMVRRAGNTGVRYHNNTYNGNWAFNGYLSAHPRPPIN